MSGIIGLYGSAESQPEEVEEKARDIGRLLGTAGWGIITGACSGLPYLGAGEAALLGAEVIGFSPVRTMEEQRRFTPHDDLSIYTRIEFTPPSPLLDDIEVAKKYRNVISTSRCDAGIIMAGRWGTLHEFCSLIDYGKVVAVLTGTGPTADALPELKETLARAIDVTFADDPPAVVRHVLVRLD